MFLHRKVYFQSQRSCCWPNPTFAALLKWFLAFKKNGGQKYFLQFQREVIAFLVFGRDNDNQFDIPREENVVRVTERHFVDQIPPTAGKRKAKKRWEEVQTLLQEESQKRILLLLPTQTWPMSLLFLQNVSHKVCVSGWHLKRQKQHTFLRKLLLENFISLCTVYYKYLYFIRLPVDSENNLNISTLLCT